MAPWLIAAAAAYALLLATVFVDQGRWTRRGTRFRVSDREVALTFDDGPDPAWTPRVLSILARHNVKATFFVVGRQVRRHPALLRAIVDAGHAVGNHGDRHRPLWRLTRRAATAEIENGARAIVEAGGPRPTLFRPAKGLFWPRQKRWIAETGHAPVMWSVAGKDWAGFSAMRILSSLSRRTNGGDIVLLHDGGGAVFRRGGDRGPTVAALGPFIANLKERGLSLVPLS